LNKTHNVFETPVHPERRSPAPLCTPLHRLQAAAKIVPQNNIQHIKLLFPTHAHHGSAAM